MAEPITFAVDISHHQPFSLDLAQTRRDGCELCIMKAGQGGTVVDSAFASNLAEAEACGQLAAAYWFVDSRATAAAHVAKIKQVVPKRVPVILDVESIKDSQGRVISAPSLALTREVYRLLLAEGYRSPLIYIPRWYWQTWGSPSLEGLPPLWSSRYPDNRVGLLAAEWAAVPASYWIGYGGLDVGLLQFTSSARIAGYQPLDASAYRGTRAQLAAVLGRTEAEPRPVNTTHEEDIMALAPAAENDHIEIPVQPGQKVYVACAWGEKVDLHALLYYGETGDDERGTGVGGGYDGFQREPVEVFTIDPNRPGPADTVPAGAVMATVRYTAKHSFSVWAA